MLSEAALAVLSTHRATRLTINDAVLDPRLRDAVRQVHDGTSTLKQQLH
jgi:hypothetical protein